MELPLQPTSAPEATLIARTVDGDLSAFDYIVDRHQVAVKAYIGCRVRDPSAVDDLAQETFIHAFKRLADFDRTRPLLPWLRGIAFNLMRNHRRTVAKATTTDDIESFFTAETEASSRHEDEAVDALRTCLQALGFEQRELLTRRYEQGMSVADICKLTGAKHSAVTMSLYRIRTRLEDCISKKLPGWKSQGDRRTSDEESS
ncbi:MAG: RNA polymerase sigma factor [Planctomycetota bacterium]